MRNPDLIFSTETGKRDPNQRLLKTSAYYAAFIVLGLVAAALGPTLPVLAQNTRSGLNEISYLFSARSFGYLLTSLIGGRLYDHLPGHPPLAISLILITGLLALTPVISLLWLLIIVLFIQGIAQGFIDVGGNTLIVWIHKEKVGPFMNGLHFMWGVGAFLSPIIIAQMVLLTGDIKWGYWSLALTALPVGIWLLNLASPEIPVKPQETVSDNGNYLLVGSISVFLLLYVGIEVGFGGWVYTYSTALGLCNATNAALLTAIFWGTLSLGRLLTIPLAIYLKPQLLLTGNLAGGLASIILILLWPQSGAILWISAVSLGLSISGIFPTALALAERQMKITGQITGWFFVGASVGGMSIPWLIGQLFEPLGPLITIRILLIDILLAIVVFIGILYVQTLIKIR